MKRKESKVSCHTTNNKKKINVQTKEKGLTMINATSGDFVMHRRLMLKIALKINDRKNENFTVAGEADETNEEKINEVIAIDETAEKEEEKVNKTITADDEAINGGKDVTIAKSKYLTKVFSTTLVIMVFNS